VKSDDKKRYVWADLPPSGLGNRLFAWSRAIVYSRLHRIPMVKTRWWQLRIGPLLRRESDYRWYFSQLNQSPDDIWGVRKLCIFVRNNYIEEPVDLETLPDEKGIIRFTGWGEYFSPLVAHQDYIRSKLMMSVNPRCLGAIQCYKETLPPIGIHVRRGDFRVICSEQQLKSEGAVQTPIDWYIKVLKGIRMKVGHNVPAFVVSDGTDVELQQLLEVRGVQWISSGTALGDLLLLSRSKVLIGSGGSTFSGWGAFLGNLPIVTCEGQSLSWYGLESEATGGMLSTVGLDASSSVDQEQIALLANFLKKTI